MVEANAANVGLRFARFVMKRCGGAMAAEGCLRVEGVRRCRVEFVSDEGIVVLLMPDGQRRTTTILPKSVPLVRRLAALDKELDLEPQR